MIKLKLPLRTSAPDSHRVMASHWRTLAEAPDWEVVGVAVFDGKVNFLVFVGSKVFYQVGRTAFDSANLEIPPGWRMVTGAEIETRLPGVTMLLAHPLIASDPELVGLLIDMDADAMAALRAALSAPLGSETPTPRQ
jgi:hypothetical protein